MSCCSPVITFGRVGPAALYLGKTVELARVMEASGEKSPKNVNIGDLAQPFVCCVAAWAREICLPPLLHLLRLLAGRTGLRVMRVGGLAMPLTICRTWESRACTSHGQHGFWALLVIHLLVEENQEEI